MRFPSKERGCLSVTFHISLLVRVAWTEEGREGQIRHNQTFMLAKFIYFFLRISALLVGAVQGQ